MIKNLLKKVKNKGVCGIIVLIKTGGGLLQFVCMGFRHS